MLTRISNLRSISADSSVSSNDVRKIIFPTGSLTNNSSGTITLAFSGDGSSFTNLNAGNLASGTLPSGRFPALTGDVTTTAGSLGTTIAAASVTLAKMANLAANSILGNNTGVGATPIALTATQVKTLLAIASTDVSGLGSLATSNTAPAGTLTGTTLNATVVTSSLTSVGTLTGGATGAGFTVALSTSTITGTLTDARLSSNVPLLNIANTFTAANYFTGTGGLNVGSATAPKGTGVSGSKLEIMGTGTGGSAFGSLAISRADGTSDSLVGSLDFYTVTTLAAQIQCNQVSGGVGGVNYLSFNLGSAGTMTTVGQFQWVNASSLGILSLGAFNGTFAGQIQVNNYSGGGTTTALLLSNPASGAANSRSAIDWRDGYGSIHTRVSSVYAGIQQTADLVFSVGQGTTNGLQDFVRLTNASHMDFYLLDSVSNQKVGGIYPSWNNSTDATRAGQINFAAMNTTNENVAFYYYADSATTTQLKFNSNNITFLGSGQPNFTAGLQLPGGKIILLNPATASSGTPLTNSAQLYCISAYWNGSASVNSASYLFSRSNYASVGSTCFVYQNYAGSGLRDMFTAGGATTGAENSQITLGNVIVSGGLSYSTFGVTTSWANNTVATRTATVNLGAFYTTTLQTGITIQANSSGNAMLGFYGATPISKSTASLVTTGYTSGSSTAVTIDGKFTGAVGSTAYTIADIVAALKNLGLITA